MSYVLAQDFAEFKIPEEIKQAKAAGVPLIGSLSFTKMIMFAKKMGLTNDHIDFFMGLKPYKMEDETKEQLKTRSVFSKQLLKYRAYLYDYSVFNKIK